MYDGGKIITGLVVFLVLVTFPWWYNLATGKASYRPEPKPPTEYQQCVESKQEMRNNHMDLLNSWRDDFVRQERTVHQAPDGRKFLKSLTRTCLGCHNNKVEFCDKCHNYVGAKPYCWDCHVTPEDVK